MNITFVKRNIGKVYHRDFPEEKFSKYFSHNYDGLKDLFSQDLYCMAAEINGDVVGYMWVATSDYYEKGLNYLFKVKKNQIYQFAGELHPNFCRSSISRDGLNFTWKYFSDKGFNSVYCYVNQYNPFSINLHKRTGFMPTNKKIIYTRILTRFKRSVSADM